MPQPEQRVVTPEEFALLTARPETRILFICIAALVAGVVQGFREGWMPHAFALIGGAIAGVLGMLVFGKSLSRRDRSWTTARSALTGFAPFLFGCYLLFVRGFWNGRTLISGFSLSRVVPVIAFVYFGYRLVYWTWQLAEIGEALRSGRLVVSEAARPAPSPVSGRADR
jgi:hypothetical protein